MGTQRTGPPTQWLAWRPGQDVARLRRTLSQARDSFLASPDEFAVDQRMRAVVLSSWRRASRAGVDPDHPTPDVVDAATLAALREQCALSPVVPVIRNLLLDAANDAGMVVAITDENGRLLWVEGDRGVRSRAESIGFLAGADWSESRAGTNAPGTALALDHSIQIFAFEHFSRPVHNWSCSAVPVHDPDTGAVIGAVDLTGGDRVAAPEVLSLVRATVTAAESELRLRRLQGTVRPRPHRRPQERALNVLGRERAELIVGSRTVALSTRHAELLLLLAQSPAGLTADEIAVELAERDLDSVTVRAEMSRLRRAIGADLIASRPYRLAVPVRTDIDDVRRLLGRRELGTALDAYRGPVLPASFAPGVSAVRDELRAELRFALLAERDPALLLRWGSTASGRDDYDVWTLCAQLCPDGSPDQARARAHLVTLERALAAT